MFRQVTASLLMQIGHKNSSYSYLAPESWLQLSLFMYRRVLIEAASECVVRVGLAGGPVILQL